jgi:hypothetical protein
VREGTRYAQNVASLSFAGVQTSDIEPAPQAPAQGGPKRDMIIVTPLPQTADNYFALFTKSGAREAAQTSAINILK